MGKVILSTACQLLIGFVVVSVGWDVLYLAIQPTSSNWMWIYELKVTYALLSIVIFLSNILTGENKTMRVYAVIIQLLLVLGYAVSRYPIFPHRILFVFAAYTVTILVFFPIHLLVSRFAGRVNNP